MTSGQWLHDLICQKICFGKVVTNSRRDPVFLRHVVCKYRDKTDHDNHSYHGTTMVIYHGSFTMVYVKLPHFGTKRELNLGKNI